MSGNGGGMKGFDNMGFVVRDEDRKAIGFFERYGGAFSLFESSECLLSSKEGLRDIHSRAVEDAGDVFI